MTVVGQFGRALGSAIWLLCLASLIEAGCSRPVGLHGDDSTAQSGQRQAPFQDGTGTSSAKPTLTPVEEHSAIPENFLPFRDDQNLPAGTLLTVRLKDPISAENPGATGTFEAVVDEPLLVDGNTLIPRGASVAGRVESARAFKAKSRGYVRLVLDSIDIAGPILCGYERIDETTLVESARTKAQSHLLAISGRRSLGEAVTDVLATDSLKAAITGTPKIQAAVKG